MVSPHGITSAIEDLPGIKQLQVIQEEAGALKVRLIVGPNPPSFKDVQKAVVRAAGIPMEVAVEFTDALEREPNGKFKAVKSLIAKEDRSVG